jgi:hypothetical protein
VYCHQPVDFVDPEHPDHVCLLVKSLYHFKQVSQATGLVLSSIHVPAQDWFCATGSYALLFVLHHSAETAYLVMYINDIILTASTNGLRHHIVQQLHDEFTIKDIDTLCFV